MLSNFTFIRSRIIYFDEPSKKGGLVQNLMASNCVSSVINTPNHKNKTALQTAYENGYMDAAQILFPAAQGVEIVYYFVKLFSLLILSF